MEERIATLRRILDESSYTVALCGSGMMEEGGYIGVKNPDKAYDIEKKYGYSPEEIFTSAFYNTRPKLFFDFYKQEMLNGGPEPTESETVLEKMEQDGKLQCIITGNIYELCQRSGCKNVIELHGSIYHNICQRCGREYPVEYIKQAHGIPVCEDCQIPIRPGLFFFREMADSQLVTQAVEEINRAEVLLLLGTNLNSEVFSHYIKYFQGKYLVIIHQRSHYLDDNADMVFIDQPKNILSRLGYL